jgi:hypothetical protein
MEVAWDKMWDSEGRGFRSDGSAIACGVDWAIQADEQLALRLENKCETGLRKSRGSDFRHWRRMEAEQVLTLSPLQVNVPKTRRTYCKGKTCKKHTQHKVTQYKAGKVSPNANPFRS